MTLRLDDIIVFAELPRAEAARKAREMGEPELAAFLGQPTESVPAHYGVASPFTFMVYRHAANRFGFIRPPVGGDVRRRLPIISPQRMDVDPALRGASLRITLDSVGVARYPGFGEHHILFNFAAQHQGNGGIEDVHFTLSHHLRDGDYVATPGHTIFRGLLVGTEGVMFRGYTVNVASAGDDALLSFLNSDLYRGGLALFTTTHPAVAQLSNATAHLGKTLASKSQNTAVHKFDLGLDFSQIASHARLAEGSYVVVQVPPELDTAWDWTDYYYDRETGQVHAQANPAESLPYNYLILGVAALDA